ncbi:MAG TPA: TetR family transcriptional regulator [Vineibacter sp.]|nr:TetR family transcriptional regulator [Vineibacter sp.]
MRTARTTARGQGEPLTPAAIVDAALRLIDGGGLATFSTRKLGQALGVEAMALYHHFPSRTALLDAVAERLITEVELPADVSDVIAWLRDVARRYVAVARRHPEAFVLLATRRFNTEAALRFVERVIAVLAGAGVRIDVAADIFRGVGAFANGAALADIAVRGAREEALVERGVDAGRLPYVARAGQWLGPAHVERQFERNLDMLLAGVAWRLGQPAPAFGGRSKGAKKGGKSREA